MKRTSSFIEKIRQSVIIFSKLTDPSSLKDPEQIFQSPVSVHDTSVGCTLVYGRNQTLPDSNLCAECIILFHFFLGYLVGVERDKGWSGRRRLVVNVRKNAESLISPLNGLDRHIGNGSEAAEPAESVNGVSQAVRQLSGEVVVDLD
ncbi:hypothetical protein H113_07187 [Trichophyton rubrum MR1459]|uniref:Uncharacterized protein n=1 Tax=Trichophyton rubrum (strain ATCC MYA-4607 / CBS 118892) TaxID=559305 RepID=A0A080WHQ6_TRIRC|nr:uncharacterized protein TERG_11850 [Trichophyton rubrum CBS 118892]EZF91690.1 hypothetical protein H113_07187 [Trichophyton rubrum MR1459]KFL60879.1 hypothetical protein TERG_11850 [Trichophyton rubrum CBS 118892]